LNIVERDKWNCVIDCENRNCVNVLREVSSLAEVANPAMPAFSWKCPYCGRKQFVQAEQVERCQGIYV
jgi:aspartate carbamoyltransferase regulatory subunit